MDAPDRHAGPPPADDMALIGAVRSRLVELHLGDAERPARPRPCGVTSRLRHLERADPALVVADRRSWPAIDTLSPLAGSVTTVLFCSSRPIDSAPMMRADSTAELAAPQRRVDSDRAADRRSPADATVHCTLLCRPSRRSRSSRWPACKRIAELRPENGVRPAISSPIGQARPDASQRPMLIVAGALDMHVVDRDRAGRTARPRPRRPWSAPSRSMSALISAAPRGARPPARQRRQRRPATTTASAATRLFLTVRRPAAWRVARRRTRDASCRWRGCAGWSGTSPCRP